MFYFEIIGFVDNLKENLFGDMENCIFWMIDFGGGVVGGFYYLYFGMKYFFEFVN